MSFEKLVSMTSRLFFVGAFAFLVLAVIEKIANIAGYTILRFNGVTRLLDYAVVLLIFVIVLELREMKQGLKSKRDAAS